MISMKVVLTLTLIMPSPAAQALSVLKSILLSLGPSINHDNTLYIPVSNYYISNIGSSRNKYYGGNSIS